MIITYSYRVSYFFGGRHEKNSYSYKERLILKQVLLERISTRILNLKPLARQRFSNHQFNTIFADFHHSLPIQSAQGLLEILLRDAKGLVYQLWTAIVADVHLALVLLEVGYNLVLEVANVLVVIAEHAEVELVVVADFLYNHIDLIARMQFGENLV